MRSIFRTAYAKSWSTDFAVSALVRSLGPVTPSLILLFCGGKHAPGAVLRGLRMAYPTAPVVGGSAAGAICREALGYSGLEIGALAIIGSDALPAIVTVDGLDRSEGEAGRVLGERIAEIARPNAPVFLFYDSVASRDPLRLHPAAEILGGLHRGLKGKVIRLVGGGMLTDLNLGDGWVFDGWSVRKHAAVALVFPSTVGLATQVAHGCRPASSFMEITRIEGAEVFELDGRPALDVIETMLKLPLGTTDRMLSLSVTLGEKLGDPFAPYDENAYVNRLILNANRATNSITLFEPDFAVGTRVQIMSRDNELMLQSAYDGVEVLGQAASAPNHDAAFSLYIDCAGRASAVSGAREEEADIVRQGFPQSVPFLGFYSGVEIAPFGDCARALDWTGVLATVSYSHDRQ